MTAAIRDAIPLEVSAVDPVSEDAVDGCRRYRLVALSKHQAFGARHPRDVPDRVIARCVALKYPDDDGSEVGIRRDDFPAVTRDHIPIPQRGEGWPNTLF